jgi:hypothetical protein
MIEWTVDFLVKTLVDLQTFCMCFACALMVGDWLLDENRINIYRQVAAVHEHVWRTVCSVCATGARVARPVPCNS